MPSPTLSPNDSQTLSLLLDQPPCTQSTLIDPTLPSPNPNLQAQERSILNPLNTAKPSTPTLTQAITELTSLINSNPTYASAYNNRAQALRLLHGDDLTHEDLAASTAWNDLCTAIFYASPSLSEQQQSDKIHSTKEDVIKVSPFAAKVLGAAYTQRGRLLVKLSQRKEGKEDSWDGVYEDLLPDVLKGKSAGVLEEMANRDFEWGGRYGC